MTIYPVSGQTDVFSQNLDRGIVHLVGEITDEMAASVMAQLMELDGRLLADPERRKAMCPPVDKNEDPSASVPRIRLYINSPGGSVHAGLAIFDTMRSLHTKVDTVCVGMAASMAAVILAGGDKRYILPHAEVMIHQPSGGTSGKASDILIAADHIRERKQVLNRILAHCTGNPLEKVSADTELDHWMNPEDALSYGIVDEIMPER